MSTNTPLTFIKQGKDNVFITLLKHLYPDPIILYYRFSELELWEKWTYKELNSSELDITSIEYPLWENHNRSFFELPTLTLDEDHKMVQISGITKTFSKNLEDYYRFSITNENVLVSGNIMSLVNGSNKILNSFQFYKLFQGCENIFSTPLLPATTLQLSCYLKMFENCSQLIKTIPILPANKLANKCYKEMFAGCTNLTFTPILPAKNLIFKCYHGMFESCVGLKVISLIFAEKLATKACNYMFYNCPKIRSVKVHFKNWLSNSTVNWLNTKTEGTFYKYNSLEEIYGENGIPRSFKIVNLAKEPLTFLAIGKNSSNSVTLVQAGKPNLTDLYYSINDSNWIKYIPGKKLMFKYGDIIQFKNNSPFFSIDRLNHYQFVLEGKIQITGKVESLINFRGLTCGCFTKLFEGCSALVNTPALLINTELTDRCYLEMFAGCNNITEGPLLPALKLSSKCYKGMFRACQSLTKVPFLPANKLANNCYEEMFQGCSALTNVSKNLLQATKLTIECYKNMFSYCSNLSIAPLLPSINLAYGCYDQMFKSCTSLTKAPELPAVYLSDNCYSLMFANCTSLTKAPLLPATILATNCYCGMFRGCKNLTKSPILPAKELVDGCYENMFEYCLKIDSLTAYFKRWSIDCSDTYNWLNNVTNTSSCIFYKSKDLLVDQTKRSSHAVPSEWSVEDIFNTFLPLTFSAESGYAAVGLKIIGKPLEISLSYRKSSGSWEPYTIGTFITILLNLTLSFKGDNETFSKDYNNCYHFVILQGRVFTSGSINSLIGTDLLQPNMFTRLFLHCDNLITAPSLDSVIVAPSCYSNMFYNCDSLTAIPLLPAKILLRNCYLRMFYDCDSLTSVLLPNSIMAPLCCKLMFGQCDSLLEGKLFSKFVQKDSYNNLFANCKHLNSVKVGFTYWGSNTTTDWLYGVSPTGTFIKPPILKNNKGFSAIPLGWNIGFNNLLLLPLTFKFNGSTLLRLSLWGSPLNLKNLFYRVNNGSWNGLKVGQVLSANANDIMQFLNYDTHFSLDKDNYYHFLFKGQSQVEAYGNIMSLINFEKVVLLPYTFAYLFAGCSNLITAPLLPATLLSLCCYYNMFNSTSLVTTPELPATTIKNKCYLQMFANCSKLSAIPALPATLLVRCCYRGMFRNCTSLTAVLLPKAKLFSGCYANMFNGCTNLRNVTVHFELWDLSTVNNATTNWLANVPKNGWLNAPSTLPIIYGNNNVPIGWNSLTLTASDLTDSVVVLLKIGNPSLNPIKFKVNNFVWQDYLFGVTTGVLLHKGDSVTFRGTTNTFSNDTLNYYKFNITGGKVLATGTVMSLINYSNSLTKDYIFVNLFKNCLNLVTPPVLPASTLTNYCYMQMFQNCTNLTSTPLLPALEVGMRSYRSMFFGCTSLTVVNNFLALKLNLDSCQKMFMNCSNLNSIEVNFTSWNNLKTSTNDWLVGVSLTGTFIKPELLAVTNDESHIPVGWTVVVKE